MNNKHPDKIDNRQRQSRFAARKKVKELLQEGKFDLIAFLNAPDIQASLGQAIKDGLAGKKTNSNLIKLTTELIGLYKAQKEDNKSEFSPADYITIAREVTRSLKGELETGGGNCPVCGQPAPLRNEPYLYPEPEQPADREVETVDISF